MGKNMVYYIESELSPKDYLLNLKSRFHSPFALFCERVTGVAAGPFFSVAYYSPYHWNRKITNECNRAFGLVKVVDGKTQVHFIYSKGLLSPFWLLFYFLLPFLVFLFNGLVRDVPVPCWIGSTLISALVCGSSAIRDSLTEEGIAGVDVLTSLLMEPDQFYY